MIIGFIIDSIDPNFLQNTARHIYFEVTVLSKQNIWYKTLNILKSDWWTLSCQNYLMSHSGPEGSLSQQKLIIYMSYISKKVMKNAIQIHWNQNWALRDFNVMVIYFHLYHGYPQWILRIWEVFPLLYSRLKNYPHSVIHIMKGIIEAYLKM